MPGRPSAARRRRRRPRAAEFRTTDDDAPAAAVEMATLSPNTSNEAEEDEVAREGRQDRVRGERVPAQAPPWGRAYLFDALGDAKGDAAGRLDGQAQSSDQPYASTAV